MTGTKRNAGRGLILAAMVVGVSLAATGCSAQEPAAKPGAPAATPDAVKPQTPLEPLSIDTAKGRVDLMVEIADDEAERQRGLMYRTSLAPDRGMLFDFEDAAPRAFWMKNTYIPLDIIYIGPNGRIISIAAMTEPFNETPVPSRGAASGVLEIYGGRAAELGIEVGDRVHHRIFPK